MLSHLQLLHQLTMWRIGSGLRDFISPYTIKFKARGSVFEREDTSTGYSRGSVDHQCYALLPIALQWGGVAKSWGSADVVGTLVGFLVLTLAFIICEYYQGERAFLLKSVIKN